MKYGAERAMMLHPSGLYGQFTTGSGRIDARLAQGWTIIPCERNHLTRESKETEGSTARKNDTSKAEKPTDAKPNERGKRPRIKPDQRH